MSNIEKVKQLRQQTGLSFAEIKKALDEANGDEAGAVELLKARGVSVAAKKSSRETSQGIVEAYIHSNKKVGSIMELLCETDFVAKNDDFKELAHELAMQITSMSPQNKKELLAQQYVRDPNQTIEALIQQYISKLGENIQVGEFTRFEI